MKEFNRLLAAWEACIEASKDYESAVEKVQTTKAELHEAMQALPKGQLDGLPAWMKPTE